MRGISPGGASVHAEPSHHLQSPSESIRQPCGSSGGVGRFTTMNRPGFDGASDVAWGSQAGSWVLFLIGFLLLIVSGVACLVQVIRRRVKLVESWVGVAVLPLERDGAPNLSPSLNPAGSVNGLYFNKDRATPVVGRTADPRRGDEFVTTAVGARAMGWDVGQVVPMGVFGATKFGLPGFGTPRVPPERKIDMRLVGIVVFNNQVIQDDADRYPTDVLFTPALTRTLLTSNAQGTWYAMQLAHDTAIPAVEEKLLHLLPSGSDANFTVAAITETKVERAVKPESIALGVFGAIAAMAAVAIGALAISRMLRSDEEDLNVLRALGATPATTMADGLIGVLGAIVSGSLLAVALAVWLSSLSPLGPIRAVYHPAGIAVDWTVLGLGLFVLIGGLGAIALALAYGGALHRLATKSRREHPRDSRLLQMATSSGMPASGAVGLRFALQSGRARTSVPGANRLVEDAEDKLCAPYPPPPLSWEGGTPTA